MVSLVLCSYLYPSGFYPKWKRRTTIAKVQTGSDDARQCNNIVNIMVLQILAFPVFWKKCKKLSSLLMILEVLLEWRLEHTIDCDSLRAERTNSYYFVLQAHRHSKAFCRTRVLLCTIPQHLSSKGKETPANNNIYYCRQAQKMTKWPLESVYYCVDSKNIYY